MTILRRLVTAAPQVEVLQVLAVRTSTTDMLDEGEAQQMTVHSSIRRDIRYSDDSLTLLLPGLDGFSVLNWKSSYAIQTC